MRPVVFLLVIFQDNSSLWLNYTTFESLANKLKNN